jgi:hypothetical protein
MGGELVLEAPASGDALALARIDQARVLEGVRRAHLRPVDLRDGELPRRLGARRIVEGVRLSGLKG